MTSSTQPIAQIVARARRRPRPVQGRCPRAGEVQRLVAGLTVQRTAPGGLVIEAPPEIASTLAALVAGMAGRLQAAAAPPRQPRSPGP